MLISKYSLQKSFAGKELEIFLVLFCRCTLSCIDAASEPTYCSENVGGSQLN
jgi:hypothetical protein